MRPPLRRLSVEQCVTLLAGGIPRLERRITAVHLHHTWRPTRSQFRGQATIEAIRAYHVSQNGWDDIAQHLTIDPQGFVWTGRNWNLPPASQRGRNGTAASGPFMIEMIGNFDDGHDELGGAQRDTVVRTIAAILQAAGLRARDVYFHRELGSPKSCPGTGIDKAALLRDVERLLRPAERRQAGKKGAKRKPKPAAPLPFERHHLLGHEVLEPAGEPAPGYDAREVPEHEYAAEFVQDETRARMQAATLDRARDVAPILARTDSKWRPLEPHVINLTRGRLSQSGEFTMPDGAIDRIVQAIREYAVGAPRPRIMLHAHGGLVGEREALQYALQAHTWWLRHGVYPIYFVWETSVFETIKQRLGLARGIRGIGDWWDRRFENFARPLGKPLWSDMKESALLASSVDAGLGDPGGVLIFAEALASLVRSRPGGKTIALHAVGHSAGAIFHSHLLPALIGLKVSIDSLALLAPAVRIDLFKQLLLPRIADGGIRRFEMYTMDEEAERDDDLVEVIGVPIYGKSLLYLVSGAFEPEDKKAAILGLEERFTEDADVMALFGSGGHRLELSHAKGKPHNPATHARKHGCFDNDAATLASVLTTVTGAPPGEPFPVIDEGCEKAASRAALDLPILIQSPTLGAPGLLTFDRAARPASGVRRALCVGIDSYVQSPLGGCVRDAQTWAAALRGLRFDVTTVLDRDATRGAMLDVLRALVTGASPGDLLVFQYSGHGTQAQDLDGDEKDRYDEALVPVDYHTGALLIDDDLADVYRQLPDGVVLTLFMDCCHSGTNSRFAPIDRSAARGSERRRFLPLTPDVEAAHRRFRAAHGSPRPTSPEESLPGIVHFAACLDNQYAYESDGQGHFTRVAAGELAGAVSRQATNEEFGSDVAAKVIALGKPQTPRLMRLPAALADRPLLGEAAGAAAGPGPVPEGDRAWAEWCLRFFESGAAHWRRQLGQ